MVYDIPTTGWKKYILLFLAWIMLATSRWSAIKIFCQYVENGCWTNLDIISPARPAVGRWDALEQYLTNFKHDQAEKVFQGG